MIGLEISAKKVPEPGITLEQYERWSNEIKQQPPFRARADIEADYYDGNQLNSSILAIQKELGIPPAIEPLIGPTIDSVLGMEVRARRDFRIVADDGGDQVAKGLNLLLNKAEKRSFLDRACSQAYASQIKTGIGWVEVSRNPDPFGFSFRCNTIHRNEIFWDMFSKMPDLSDARYLRRQRWLDLDQAKLMFPEKSELIRQSGTGWNTVDFGMLSMDGGTSTDLAIAYDIQRGSSIEEQEWNDTGKRRICLSECWYRVWLKALILKTRDGRVIEFNETNPVHIQAAQTGFAQVIEAVISKVRLSWWLGPHLLYDSPSPYRHNKFPYVPFWGKKEDRTGVPYGLIRGMMYLQDEVNARISKMQWLLSAVRTERTEGAVAMDDISYNYEVAKPNADIKLSASHMAQPGARYEVRRELELNRQQYDRLLDAREGIKRTGGIYNSFMGQAGQGNSGIALNTLVEQSIQTLADINDNFRDARMQVGDLLLSLLIEDIGSDQHEVVVKGHARQENITIILNEPTVSDTGVEYLNNDIQRMKVSVELEDVPSTPTFRAQQLEVLKSALQMMPAQYQSVVMPFFMQLMDLPNRDEMIEAIKSIDQQITPDRVKELIDKAVEAALLKAQIGLKERELDIKERLAKKDEALKGIGATKAAMEAGAIVAMNPNIAGIGDAMIDVGLNINNKEDQVEQNIQPQAQIQSQAPAPEQNESPGMMTFR